MDIELLVTHTPSGASQHFTGQVADRLQLGRDSASPIQFQGKSISRKHLDFLTRDGRIVIQDLSANGTWLNGERLCGIGQTTKNSEVVPLPNSSRNISESAPAWRMVPMEPRAPVSALRLWTSYAVKNPLP